MVIASSVPTTQRTPLVAVEFDSSRAQQGPALQVYEALIIAQRLATGTVAELVPKKVTSAPQAAEYFGEGSIAHAMAQLWFANNPVVSLTIVGLDDDGSAVDATEDIVVTAAPTETGTLYLYVAGRRMAIAVDATDTVTTVGDKIEAAITAITDIPVTASNAAGTVTITARNGGELGNSIDLRLNYDPTENLPAGLALTIPATLASGANNPDISGVWAVLGETQYHVVACPFTDSANFTELDTQLESRWGPLRQNDGTAFTALRDTHANLVTFGDGKNSKQVSVLGYPSAPNPSYEWAAAYAGRIALEGQQDPGRPFQTLPLVGILAPAESDRFTLAERNLLLLDGISTLRTDTAGTVRIDRAITTFQENLFGVADTAFLDVTTKLVLSYIRFSVVAKFTSTYPRHKLSSDDVNLGAGVPVMTPSIARGVMVSLFRQWQQLGLVEGLDQFKQDLVVEVNESDPNRLDILLSPDVINGLIVVAARAQFLL